MHPVGAKLFHEEREMDTHMTKLIVTSCIFVNTSNKKELVGVTCSSCRRNVECMFNFGWGTTKEESH